MTPSEIINKLLEHSGLNAKSFSERIGLEKPQAIYDIQKGKTRTISPAMANKILSVFPAIRRAWLLTGEGEMLKGDIDLKLENVDAFDLAAMGGEVYAELLNKLIRDKQLAPYALIEQKDLEIKTLNRYIGRLEERIDGLKKTNAQEEDVECADAG